MGENGESSKSTKRNRSELSPKKKAESEGEGGEQKPKDTELDDPPSWTRWTALSYAVVMLLLGIPLWWKTTTVQRVPLPYMDMLTLHSTLQDKLLITIPLEFRGFTSQLETLEAHLFRNVSGYSYRFSYSQMSAGEMEVVYKSNDLYHLDQQICASEAKHKGPDTLKVYYVGRADLLKEFGHQVILGNCRSMYYISNKSQIDIKRMEKILLKLAWSGSELQVQNGKEVNKESLQLPLSAGYDILLSLLVPEPEVLESTWQIENAVKDYFEPIVKKLNLFAEFTVRSQVLHYVKLNVMPKYNSRSGIFEIPYAQLPLVINPVESKLSSFVSQNPALNFLTYTAPCDKYPLQIIDEDGNGLMSNAFLVPQWGGIFIYNSPCPQRNESLSSAEETYSDRKSVKHDVSMEEVMAVVLSQFRSLIGLSDKMQEEGVLDFRGSALRDWEVDLLVRRRLRYLLFTSGNTLQSLGNLLDKITNIVVTNQVGREVEKSVQSLKEAIKHALIGNLAEAQEFALKSFKASEIAFHHPTNLAQLYFPDDQKYAIYIPLFLPVGIPVLFSLRAIFKGFRKGLSQTKVKEE